MIPYGKQDINQSDIDSVIEVLQSDFLTQGNKVPEFEKALTDYTGAKYATAVNSATSALHLACLAFDLGQGDWLWTSPISFVASANCGLYCNAQVDFVDIDPISYNLCPKALEKKLKLAKQTNRLPKVLITVHLSGQSCDMKKIQQLSKEYGFNLIEDASHAVGSSYCDTKIGSCVYSDITVFSFHPVKIVTTAEGGAALTNNSDLANKMNLLRSHGITRDPALMDQALMDQVPHGDWYYQQIALGHNYRMSDIQAALGISQIQRLDEFVSRRHALAARYNDSLKSLPIVLPLQAEQTSSSWHLYIIQLDTHNSKITHQDLFNLLRANKVGVNLHYIPIHLQPYYQQLGFKQGDFPNAESYYQQAITLPLFFAMTDEQQDSVIATLKEILEPK